MKLVTKEIEKLFEQYPLYSQDGKRENAVCVVKFFLTGGAHTWYILEADISKDLLFGITVNGYGECEYGYTSLSELQKIRNSFGLGVERDRAFKPTPLNQMRDEGYLTEFINELYS